MGKDTPVFFRQFPGRWAEGWGLGIGRRRRVGVMGVGLALGLRGVRLVLTKMAWVRVRLYVLRVAFRSMDRPRSLVCCRWW